MLLVGVYAPGVLLASFVPMLLIASALLSVLTGYVGRHLSAFVVEDLRAHHDPAEMQFCP